MKFYLDSSAAIRLMAGRPGRVELPDASDLVASELAVVECLRVMDRFRHSAITPWTDAQYATGLEAVGLLFRKVRLVEVTTAILWRAADPVPVALGTLDSIHLSTALWIREHEGEAPVIATHDLQLAEAARQLRFEVAGA